MSQSVKIAGALFQNVPSISVPDENNVYHGFFDVSDTTATASDVASGKFFHDALGVLTAGTASGGGGGLVYETGTYTPAADIATPTISFSNTHSTPPWAICIAADSSSFLAANSNLWWTYNSFYYGVGVAPFRSSSGHHYGVVRYGYRSSSVTAGGVNLSALTGSSTSSLSYWVTSSEFTPSTESTSRYYRAGTDYKWIAVWAPT